MKKSLAHTTDPSEALWAFVRLVAGLMVAYCITAAPVAAQQPNALVDNNRCTLLKRSAPRAVVRVLDGATLLLDNGDRVRLAGILIPSIFDTSPPRKASDKPRVEAQLEADPWSPAVAAKDALNKFTLGRPVAIADAERHRDRYGRSVAHVFATAPDNTAVWLQAAMLTAGHARAYGTPDNFNCISAMQAAEETARLAGRGIWSNPAYAIRPAWQTRALLARRGTFQLVQGRVRNATRARGGQIYLNFGDNWRSDFTAKVAPAVSRSNPAWAASLLDLAGRDVRVRGWISRRNGPMIDVEHPSQITVLESGAEAPLPARDTQMDGKAKMPAHLSRQDGEADR
ncbi:MAG: thermonuclease family protein [Hyphomicrobiaceae bacterium]|nr:thermonuclease family protein [Hyphomicrobiaceae bacterium]MCC0011200.1 thermonuclease family protein [Hyphomicrobiaceae bacterium]